MSKWNGWILILGRAWGELARALGWRERVAVTYGIMDPPPPKRLKSLGRGLGVTHAQFRKVRNADEYEYTVSQTPWTSATRICLAGEIAPEMSPERNARSLWDPRL